MSTVPEPVIIGFEATVNPHFYLLHVRRHLTDELAEKYNRSTMTQAPDWIRPFFDFQPISDVHVMRHRIRFRTYKKGYSWQLLVDYLVKKVLSGILGPFKLAEVDSSEPRRNYVMPVALTQLTVVEGLKASRAHPFTAAVYAIEGVTELKCQDRDMIVKRSPLYSWAEIEEQLVPLLGL